MFLSRYSVVPSVLKLGRIYKPPVSSLLLRISNANFCTHNAINKNKTKKQKTREDEPGKRIPEIKDLSKNQNISIETIKEKEEDKFTATKQKEIERETETNRHEEKQKMEEIEAKEEIEDIEETEDTKDIEEIKTFKKQKKMKEQKMGVPIHALFEAQLLIATEKRMKMTEKEKREEREERERTKREYEPYVKEYLRAIYESHADEIYLTNADLKGFEIAKNTGVTPLHVAAAVGNPEQVLYFLQRGYRVDSVTNEKAVIHHQIAHSQSEDDKDVYGSMLRNYTWLDGAEYIRYARGNINMTPLHRAARFGRVDCIKLLILHDAQVTAATSGTLRPLFFAAANCHAEAVKALVPLSPLDQMEMNDIFRVCMTVHDDIDIYNDLIDGGAQVMIPEDKLNNQGQPIHFAAQHGQFETVEILLEKGADPNCVNKFDYSVTPLHYAAKKSFIDVLTYHLPVNYTEIMQYLLNAGAKIDARDEEGFTPLHFAAQAGFAEGCELLIKNGADVNALNQELLPPLHFALLSKDEKTVKLLLRKGAKIEPYGEEELYPLHTIALQSLPQMIPILLKANPEMKIDVTDKGNRTPLHLAAGVGGDLATVKKLIELGANVNAQDGNIYTPLFMATCKDRVQIIEELVKAGANLKLRTLNGETLLLAAVTRNFLPTVKKLVELGADIEGNDPISPELAALRSKITEENVVQMIEEELPELNDAFAGHFTPLHFAAALNLVDMVKLLVECGANIEAKDIMKASPLAVAIREDSDDTTRELVQLGADLETRDHEGYTPLHGAVIVGKIELVDFLLSFGADPNCKSNGGLTPKDLAKETEQMDIMERFLLVDTTQMIQKSK